VFNVIACGLKERKGRPSVCEVNKHWEGLGLQEHRGVRVGFVVQAAGSNAWLWCVALLAAQPGACWCAA
jgi:hypothetical protein